MEDLEFTLTSNVETAVFGKALGTLAQPGDIICLDGDLGAGKTTLTQSIAVGLGVPENCYVTSPSFAIFHEYPGRLPLYHMDFYRLHDYTEVEDLGLEEYFYLQGLCVIEWALRAEEVLPAGRLHFFISIDDEECRTVKSKFDENLWGERLTSIVKTLAREREQ